MYFNLNKKTSLFHSNDLEETLVLMFFDNTEQAPLNRLKIILKTQPIGKNYSWWTGDSKFKESQALSKKFQNSRNFRFTGGVQTLMIMSKKVTRQMRSHCSHSPGGVQTLLIRSKKVTRQMRSHCSHSPNENTYSRSPTAGHSSITTMPCWSAMSIISSA